MQRIYGTSMMRPRSLRPRILHPRMQRPRSLCPSFVLYVPVR
jgi:hypothetical protein